MILLELIPTLSLFFAFSHYWFYFTTFYFFYLQYIFYYINLFSIYTQSSKIRHNHIIFLYFCQYWFYFSAVNESVWEHLKIFFVPALFFTLFAFYYKGEEYPFLKFDTITLFSYIFANIDSIYVILYTFCNLYLQKWRAWKPGWWEHETGKVSEGHFYNLSFYKSRDAYWYCIMY